MYFALKYPHLFQPLRVRGAYLRCRLTAAPQGFYNVGGDRYPTAEAAAFYERKAMGGFACVTYGDLMVDGRTGKYFPWVAAMDNTDMLPRLSMVAHAISRHGSVASAELSHDGEFSRASRDEHGTLYGVVERDNKYGRVEQMSEEIIDYIIDRYYSAAVFAKQCGFGMVTIHGGHGWLPQQFMSETFNTRKDRWGGSFENRMRFPLAIVDAVRRAVGPNFPIEFRMSGSEIDPGGYDIDYGVRIAEALDGKVDIIHVSAGVHEIDRTFFVVHPSMFLEDGCNSKYAREIKKHVRSYVATVGAFTEPGQMEEIIASGGADIIALGRQSLADPDFPMKARAGREEEIARCLRCNGCFENAGKHRIFRCALNPEIGQELEAMRTPPAVIKKKVLVAGGGAAGMEAAIQASRRGHSVTLCESSGKLGGVLLCEEKVPFKKHLSEYLARQEKLCRELGVRILLNTPASPELARAESPDVIIAAVGSKPIIPRIDGIDLALCAQNVYEDPSCVQDRVVIIGGGLVGIELAIWLGMSGKKVSIVEMAQNLAVNINDMAHLAYRAALEDHGVRIYLSSEVRKITESSVTVCGPGGEFSLEADTVVYAVGREPLDDEANSLHGCAPEFYLAGDCMTPDNIMAATKVAFAAANNIGRM